jgi:glycosyltransferase involved in cell wall biosynthesis
MKITFVSNHPLPYHTPILNELANLVELHVLYMARRHALSSARAGSEIYDDPWGVPPRFSHSFHWSRALRSSRLDFRVQVSAGASLRLARLRPDVVLFSSWGPLMVEPLVWKGIARRRALMWAESTRWSGLARGRLSNLMRRQLLRRVDAFVSNGTEATKYLGALGVDGSRIVTSCLPSRTDVRLAEDGRMDAPRYLFVGRLSDRKQPEVVVESFAAVLRHVPKATLTIVGDGPLRSRIASLTRPLGDSARMLGKIEGPDLDPIYRRHDILVLPAKREVWGLVVNEALAHGLFVVATDEVGSAADLLDPSSGIVVPVDEREALAAAMTMATTAGFDQATRATRADRVVGCTFSAFAEAIFDASQLALNDRPHPHGS